MDVPGTYNFSEEEIREQLEKFGFHHIPRDKLHEFKKDLDILIRSEKSKLAEEAHQNMSYTSDSTMSPAPRTGAHYPYRPLPQFHAPAPIMNPADGVKIHVTGIDPAMRRMHASATYYQADERLTRSAPTSPTKSVGSVTDSERERKTIKRKVLRKVNGESVIDESFVESESDDSIIVRENRVRTAPLPFSEIGNHQRRPRTAPSAPVGGRLYFEEPYGKSVIYPMAQAPHEKNVRRCDRLNRYLEFKEYWEHNRVPGEKSHKSLRWNVRENMLQYDPIVKKSQKTQVPNTYVVPTEKKRMALRWQVRAQLADGRMPGTGYVST